MQDSIGGNAKTLMFVNISPSSFNMEETIISLSYASRVKQVTNSVTRNSESREIARLKNVSLCTHTHTHTHPHTHHHKTFSFHHSTKLSPCSLISLSLCWGADRQRERDRAPNHYHSCTLQWMFYQLFVFFFIHICAWESFFYSFYIHSPLLFSPDNKSTETRRKFCRCWGWHLMDNPQDACNHDDDDDEEDMSSSNFKATSS